MEDMNMQEKMEQAIRDDIVVLYPENEDHIYRKMKMELVSCDYEKKELLLRYPIQEWELNHMNTMHGGLIGVAMDSSGGLLLRSLTHLEKTPTTNMSINYLTPAMRGDNLMVQAIAERIGRNLANVYVKGYSEHTGKIVATATINYMLIRED